MEIGNNIAEIHEGGYEVIIVQEKSHRHKALNPMYVIGICIKNTITQIRFRTIPREQCRYAHQCGLSKVFMAGTWSMPVLSADLSS